MNNLRYCEHDKWLKDWNQLMILLFIIIFLKLIFKSVDVRKDVLEKYLYFQIIEINNQ
jgi:ABC-type phosphate/phosphonate transport system permease subunit